MTVAGDCVVCALERVLISRSMDLRAVLSAMNPMTDRYGGLFEELVAVDRDLRTLKGRVRER